MSERRLHEWLSLLEKRHPVEIELGLGRISDVAARLNLGTIAGKVVVVAGTNGKGSCVRVLEQLALASDLTVAAYTSPHIETYNERLRIHGENVSSRALCDAFDVVESARQNTPLTYFETGTLAAMVIMAASELDIAILEVGLGGRFDAVNIVDSDVAVITPIAIDHVSWLGRTREAIGFEKAGIARSGCPLVCCDENPPGSLINYVKEVAAVPYFIGKDFCGQDAGGGLDATLRLAGSEECVLNELPWPSLPLPSVLAAMQTAFILGFLPERGKLDKVLMETRLPGRYQKLVVDGKKVILDVAHNPSAAVYLAGRLADEHNIRRVFCVAAIMRDKDATEFVRALKNRVTHWLIGDLADNSRALGSAQLASVLKAEKCRVSLFTTVTDAFDRALDCAGDNDIIVVCGSFFTVSAIVKYKVGESDG